MNKSEMKTRLDECAHQIKQLQTKLDRANDKIAKLRKHSSECMIYRFSALGCICGLDKKVKQ